MLANNLDIADNEIIKIISRFLEEAEDRRFAKFSRVVALLVLENSEKKVFL